MSGRPGAADVICIAQRIKMKPGKTERSEVNEPLLRSHCSEQILTTWAQNTNTHTLKDTHTNTELSC